jgi:hypothetical protein
MGAAGVGPGVGAIVVDPGAGAIVVDPGAGAVGVVTGGAFGSAGFATIAPLGSANTTVSIRSSA